MDKKWWHHLTAYQIYTRSFCDSNGDGIGDFQGIISKLDYLQELGVGAIWISPFNDSPNYDNGYDISDYYAILKDFGTTEDLEELVKECEKRDIIVMMDLVLNHSSNEHPGFWKRRKTGTESTMTIISGKKVPRISRHRGKGHSLVEMYGNGHRRFRNIITIPSAYSSRI